MKKLLISCFVLSLVLVGCGKNVDYTDPSVYIEYQEKKLVEVKEAYEKSFPDSNLDKLDEQISNYATKNKKQIEESVRSKTIGLNKQELKDFYSEFTENIDQVINKLVNQIKKASETKSLS